MAVNDKVCPLKSAEEQIHVKPNVIYWPIKLSNVGLPLKANHMALHIQIVS